MALNDFSRNAASNNYDSVSNASKAKLSSFRYDKAKSNSTGSQDALTIARDPIMSQNTAGQQNVNVNNKSSDEGEDGAPHVEHVTVEMTDDRSAVNGAAEPPQTPFKLSLTNLVNNDSSYAATPQTEPSPEDRILWRSRLSSSVSRDVTPRHGDQSRDNGHDAASPPSSPLAAVRTPYLPRGQPAQGTTDEVPPPNDIAAELWSRYLVSTGKPTKAAAEGAPGGPLPLTPDPVKRDLKLRRAASCNTYWPSAKRRRRRIDGNTRSELPSIPASRSKGAALSPGSSSGGSKISILVEKIQETLKKETLKKAPAKPARREPSASVPLPQTEARLSLISEHEEAQQEASREGRTDDKLVSTSEFDDFDFNDALLLDSETSIENAAQSSPPSVPKEGPAVTTPSLAAEHGRSEFSDDDLDDAFLELLTDKTSVSGAKPLAANPPSPMRPTGASDKLATTDQVNHNVTPEDSKEGDAPQPQSPQHAATHVQLDDADAVMSRTPISHPITEPARSTSARKSSRSKTFPMAKSDLDDFGDDFDDDMDDIFAELADCDDGAPGVANDTSHSSTATADSYGDFFDASFSELNSADFQQTASAPRCLPQRTKVIQRYHVLDVGESSYKNPNGQLRPEKVLHVQEDRTGKSLAVILRDSWYASPAAKGIYIHIVGEFTRNGQCIVDDTKSMVILHPDHLISATVVASSFSCMRQAVLQDRIKATDDASKPQVYGMILHEIFQQALKENRWDLPWLKSEIDRALVNNIEKLYEIDVTVQEATRHLMSKMTHLKKWATTFMLYSPSPESLMQDRGGGTSRMSINKLLEVEEHVWSPMYGLKGNIDATVQVALHDGDEKASLTIPLEFKTGSKDTSEVHRAQTAMYCLLMSDRYGESHQREAVLLRAHPLTSVDIDVTFGILYYLETAATFRIRAIRQEIVHMIQQRNELAEYVRNKFELPPMIKRPQACNGCYSKKHCFLYHKLLEGGDEVTSGMGEKFTEVTDHLKPSHQEFFTKWERLLTLEEREMMKFRRELWSMLSHEREGVGRCFGDLVIEPQSTIEDADGPKINRYKYTLVKKSPKAGFTFAESQIGVGEPIIISDEDGHFALANGYVTQISSKRITVAVDRRLHNSRLQKTGFDAMKNQSFTGIMEIVERNGKASTLHPSSTENDTVYRLDKDGFSNGMALVRNNMLSMMDKEKPQARRLRELIIDDHAPRFRSLPSSAITAIALSQTNLNVDQKNAIEKVLSADDYALVLGMPGTGKTTTIAHIIRALVSKGKSVLLTSYTHTAVDNILLKTKEDGYRTLRIGALSKIHPEVQGFVDLASTPRHSIEELRDIYEKSQVVATTCLGINHPIFNHRSFDYCIVDEASQITLPVCLGPIRMAKTFVLVGDHFQLPPLVQNKEALKEGLDVSLFRWLCDRQPKSVVYLEHQYRMCEEVMHLSNHLIYNNHLKCGTPGIAAAQLNIPDMQGLENHHRHTLKSFSLSATHKDACLGPRQGGCWLRDLVDPAVKARLVNTDTLAPQALEDAKGSRIVNEIEATIVAQLVDSLVSVGISAAEIGVVTLYRSQLALLRTRLNHRLPDLEMHTADRFQGRDKEVIIMSCVRSNPENNVGDLLRDYRRVNVAFTRAKTKLLIVGSRSTLHGGTELLAKFVRLMAGKRWIYDLPRSAAQDHVFPEQDAGMTQTTPQKRAPTGDNGASFMHHQTARIIKTEDAGSSRSPIRTLTEGDMNNPSPSKKVRFLKDSQPCGGNSPLSTKQSNIMNMMGRKRQPTKVGAKRLDGAKIISKRPVLRDLYNDSEG